MIDPGPWTSLDEAVRYHYLLALEENRVSASFRHPGDPTTILWSGSQSLDQADLPKRISDIPDMYRYTPPVAETLPAPERTGSSDDPPKALRYYNPRQLPGQSET